MIDLFTDIFKMSKTEVNEYNLLSELIELLFILHCHCLVCVEHKVWSITVAWSIYEIISE